MRNNIEKIGRARNEIAACCRRIGCWGMSEDMIAGLLSEAALEIRDGRLKCSNS